MDGEDGVRNWGGQDPTPSAFHSPPRRQRTPPPPHTMQPASSTAPQQRRGTPNYTLLAAGRPRTGKTSFLRLLLDTAVVAPSASPDQLSSVARFVQGAPSSTTHLRTCSVDVLPDSRVAPITLELIDTAPLDHSDEDAAERVTMDIIRLVESRFERTFTDQDHSPPPTPLSDTHVHLCLYFLDPDLIVPPPSSIASPLATSDPRSRANSASQHSHPLHLEPPVPTHPSSRTAAHLPNADISAIRRLSTRVNVLPVIGRADSLTDARLAAVKLAVRRDLADAGIGFGIFDDGAAPPPMSDDRNRGRSPSVGTAQLPYALVAPDMYGHSDGVGRSALARHELMLQYAPAQTAGNNRVGSQRGRFTRTFRWGGLDVMEPRQCDFVLCKGAVFQHMETLVNYTYEYLYGRYKAGEMSTSSTPYPASQRQPPPAPAHLSPYGQPSVPGASTHPLSPATSRLPHPDVMLHSDRDMLGRPRALSTLSSTSNSGKQMRGKKITVACNFCRSRKLKCDGGRPACSQCTKRDVPCDYIPHLKRRGPLNDGDGGDDADMDVDVHEPENTPPEELSDNEHPRTWDERERDRIRERERERERDREMLMDRREYAPLPPPSSRYQHPADRDRERERDDRSSLSPELERYHPPQGYGAAPPGPHHLNHNHNHHRSGDIPRLPPTSPYGLSAVPSAAPPPPETQHSRVQQYERFARSSIVGRSRASTFAAPTTPSSGEYPPSAFSRSHGHHHNAHPHALPPIRSAGGFGGMDVDHPARSKIEPGLVGPSGLSMGMSMDREENVRQSLPTKRRMSDVGPAPPPSAMALGGTPPSVSAAPAPAKSSRAPGTAGSKVVACNFCRARKTKCDSVHPTCSSCARRSLPCSYVNDPSARGAGTRKYSNAAAQQQAQGSTTASGSGNGTSGNTNGGHLRPRSPARIPSSNSSRSSSQSPSARRDTASLSGAGTPYGSHGHGHGHLPRHASRSEEDGADVDELADDVDEEDYPSKRPRLAPVSTASTNSASGRERSFEHVASRMIPVGISQ